VKLWNNLEELSHVYWIGGGSCAGKSTIARRLATEHGLQLYATDDLMADHARRSTPADCPLLHEFMAMDMDQRWVDRSPAEMLQTFHWFRGEGFSMIVEDILRLPREPAVIVEGFRLLPRLVNPLLAVHKQAVWLLPTPEFRQAFAQWEFIGKTSDPVRARRNLLERDAMFTERLYEETQRLELNTITVDSTVTVDDMVRQATKVLDL
jgi:2-phosphoglycerate kinase